MTIGEFKIIQRCSVTKARASTLKLAHGVVNLPTFMPVATKAAMKGILTEDIEQEIILSNTFHCRDLKVDLHEFLGYNGCMLTDSGGFQIVSLENASVTEKGVLFPIIDSDIQKINQLSDEFDKDNLNHTLIKESERVDLPYDLVQKNTSSNQKICLKSSLCPYICDKKINLNKMDPQSILNNSSINDIDSYPLKNLDTSKYLSQHANIHIQPMHPLASEKINHQGIKTPPLRNHFQNQRFILMRPEDSINIQNTLGADIIMQLDDVLNPLESREKIEVGMLRSLRWLQRCFDAHKNENQLLFPIVQGGLHKDLRILSIKGILEHQIQGIAIGGLSGGENKLQFSEIVRYCCENIPEIIPRYIMGIGYPEDILVIISLGSDMSDCVYPTRTARFGRAMTDYGDLNLNKSNFSNDIDKIDHLCQCYTCLNYTRAYLYLIKDTANFASLITMHNLFYLRNLTRKAREAIINNNFVDFVVKFFRRRFGCRIPVWIKEIYAQFGIEL